MRMGIKRFSGRKIHLPKISIKFPELPKLSNLNLDLKKLGLIAAAVILLFLVMDLNKRLNELSRLTAQQEEASTVIAVLQSTLDHLETQVAYATSEGAVEEWAYEEGHMVRENEQLIIPQVSGDITPTVVIKVTPTPVVVENWEIWLALFAGK